MSLMGISKLERGLTTCTAQAVIICTKINLWGPGCTTYLGRPRAPRKGTKCTRIRIDRWAFSGPSSASTSYSVSPSIILEAPEEVLGILSNMTFNGMPDSYERACLIEYLHYMRIHTSKLVKPEWVNIETD